MPAPTRELLSHFDRGHRDKFGLPAYPLGQKQAAILAAIWKLYGLEMTKALVTEFFAGNDFADDCGYSCQVFSSQVPRLLMKLKRRELDNVVLIDWFDECKRLHNGVCGGQYKHGMRMQIERAS